VYTYKYTNKYGHICYTYINTCRYLTSACYSLLTSCVVVQSLEPFYDQFDPDFINIRKTVREVLQKEDDLNEIVQLVGKVSRPKLPQITAACIASAPPPACCMYCAAGWQGQ